MFIITLNYIKPLAEVDRFLDEHRLFLARYYESGQFLISGPKQPRDGGIIIATAKTKAEIETIVGDDPFYREGVAEYTISEFIPSMAGQHLSEFVTCINHQIKK